MKSKIFILLISFLLSGCFSSRKTISEELNETNTLYALCEAVEAFNSVYINKVRASVLLDGEAYDAKVNLYYIPDSVIFLSAANTGFEIVRAALTPDSLVFINRIDKIVYIHKEHELGYKAPVAFSDLELLLNKLLICRELKANGRNSEELVIDLSVPNITKKIKYHGNSLKMNTFEFFHKKTGEYIVGERNVADSIMIYSNYIFDDVEIIATGGELRLNEEIKIDLSYNKKKYLLISE